MYFAVPEIANGVINQAMPGDGVLAGENFGNDAQVIVATVAGAGVASMVLRLVFDDQR